MSWLTTTLKKLAEGATELHGPNIKRAAEQLAEEGVGKPVLLI